MRIIVWIRIATEGAKFEVDLQALNRETLNLVS